MFHQPHLLMSDQPAPEVDFPISESTVDFVTQAMWGVVNEGGTAAASKLPGIEFCGKTGTRAGDQQPKGWRARASKPT